MNFFYFPYVSHRIALETKVADPELRTIVNLTHWIQYSSTLSTCADDWLILNNIVDI